MFNLYTQISTNPNDLVPDDNDHILMSNVDFIKQFIQAYNITTIWIAWGDLIDIRPYLCFSLKWMYADLVELELENYWFTN